MNISLRWRQHLRQWAVIFLVIAYAAINIAIMSPQASAACNPLPTANGTATLKLAIPSTGTYRFWAHISSGSGSSSRAYVQVDDAYCQLQIGGGSLPAHQFSWVDYQKGTATNTLKLNAGMHTVTIAGFDQGVGIDKIMFVGDSACTPIGDGNNCGSPVKMTAESPEESPSAAESQPIAASLKKSPVKTIAIISAGVVLLLAIGVFALWKTGAFVAFTFKLWHLLPLIALLAAIGGSVALFATGPIAAFLMSGSKVTGNAAIVSNSAAIGGKMVKFGIAPTSRPSPAPSSPSPSSSNGVPATPAPSPSAPPPTSPPAPSGWPGANTTGYTKAPGYPGSLHTCATPIQSNTTYEFCNFPNGVGVGTVGQPVSNVTFYGCRFASNYVVDATVRVYGDNITFNYSTFEPSADNAPPTGYNEGYQFAIDVRGLGKVTVDHSNFWGWGNAITFEASTQAKPFVVRNSWFHDARADGGVDHTDAILSNDGGPSHMVFDHNTIVSVGNTNGLALQYDHTDYHNITVTNNYFSGFGYTVNIGGNGHLHNSTFTDNVFGTDIAPTVGPLYGWGGTGNTWRRNKVHYVAGPTVYFDNLHQIGPITAADDGKYWWPDNSMSTSDYSGS